MHLRMIQVEGGSHPIVSATTNFLKLLPPANCIKIPPSMTKSATEFSKKCSVFSLKDVLNDDYTMRMPSDDEGADEAVTLPMMPCDLARS